MERYQDYVIRDGRFIGKFEEMYQKFDDPWHQEEGSIGLWSFSTIALYLKGLHVQNVLEAGCGLGRFTNFLTNMCEAEGIRITGMDISETAVVKAKQKYSHIKFVVDNISNINESLCEYDVIIFADILWYILQDIDKVIEKLSKYIKNRTLIIKQVFYKGQQKYGVEYFSNQDEMIEYFPFELLGRSEYNIIEDDTIETVTVFKIR